jgi:hypothetical protein
MRRQERSRNLSSFQRPLTCHAPAASTPAQNAEERADGVGLKSLLDFNHRYDTIFVMVSLLKNVLFFFFFNFADTLQILACMMQYVLLLLNPHTYNC